MEKLQKEFTHHDSETASQGVINREVAEATASALRELGEEQRCAIELAFFSGLTQAEIASKLGQPLGTIKARIRRGMLQLRTRLEHQNLRWESPEQQIV